MGDLLAQIFKEESSVKKLKEKLPYIFKIAELELSRGGHTGMEVGTLRERAIIAFLIYRFGEDKVLYDMPVNEAEADVKIEGHANPISIKTKTGKGFSGVKLKWTVDWDKVNEFYNSYLPSSDILFVQINWGFSGFFAYIPLSIQNSVFEELGREGYIKLPKQGTNPRGIEISANALRTCVEKTPFKISIDWKIEGELNYNPYTRWIEIWAED
ncbi:MAG: ThaI family type II restriction endonuclease [Aquificaceae bacterium]|jgi:hypothetical protein|uniref:ThaI family type II restriction endonuclease n=1 Tax=Hydrogenobacter sp. Uz 6-8 TaxID=3384828 RepID=UPI0030952E38